VAQVEVDVRSSSYTVVRHGRERWIGPETGQRDAQVELGLSWKHAGESVAAWTSSGAASASERTEPGRIPASTGYPQPALEAGSGRPSPFVEPAIVTGIVAGLAVLFFSNRDVGN
jgi:hypothetical protein